ncbi:MAG: sugar phosphate isomerase/epimerase family protein [Planctomycetota bacterium]
MPDLGRIAIHTMTHKPWDLKTCCAKFAERGVGGISVWRNVVAEEEGGCGLGEAVRIVKDSGLAVPAYVRGGFFPAGDPSKRAEAVEHNKVMLDEAAALGAEQVVLVVGAEPRMPLDEARRQVAEGIGACVKHAESVGVKLSIEPLHPMYAADKSCINRMAEARAVCEQLQSPWVGIALDVYHVWWDPDLEREIALAGEQGTLLAFHICDWRVDTRHLLTDRGLMGEGCIDLAGIQRMVQAAGFDGLAEVEVFSEAHWAEDQDTYLDEVCEAALPFGV